MFRSIVPLIATILLTFPVTAFSFQGYVQTLGDNATISWGSGEIAVTRPLVVQTESEPVQLSPLSVRKAASSARKKMLDMIVSVRIDAKRTISAYLTEDDELAARVRGLVQNSPMERPAMFEDGGEVRVSEAFRGKLAELVLPTTIQFQSGIPPRLSTSMEQNMAYSNETPEHVGGAATGYTGVIIDARGLNVTPALMPVIYGQDGVGAYGPFLVSRANAIHKGLLAYATTDDPAALKERVGLRPLKVKAVSAFGSWRTDLIVSSSMGQLVRAIMRSGVPMENCAVVVVVDAPEPKDELAEEADVLEEGMEAPKEEVIPEEEL